METRVNSRVLRNFDWITFSLVVIISIVGVMTIYSSTRSPIAGSTPSYFIKQLYWLLFSMLALIAIMSFDYIWLSRFSRVFYAIGIALLVIVLIAGKTGMGAQRWINLGIFSFQPSEVFKLFYAIALSRHLSEMQRKINLMSLLRLFFLITFIPVLLIASQPDLGTAVIIMLTFSSLIITKGLHKKAMVLVLLIGIVSLPFFSGMFWDGLKDYQKSRLVAFLDPDIDPSGIGYHINQSKVAIGSGQFIGKGYLNGTQGPFRFLPEKHTDFIFAVFSEEWGFLGSVLLLLLYLALILRGLDTARKAKDEFGRLLGSGISFMFAIYLFVNIGMTMGIMPVVGVPLPFMSYGGTALLTNFIAAGILINIRTRRFELFY